MSHIYISTILVAPILTGYGSSILCDMDYFLRWDLKSKDKRGLPEEKLPITAFGGAFWLSMGVICIVAGLAFALFAISKL